MGMTHSDLLQVVYRFYRRDMNPFEPEHKDTEERERLREAVRRGVASYGTWEALLDRLRPRYPFWNRSVCLLLGGAITTRGTGVKSTSPAAAPASSCPCSGPITESAARALPARRRRCSISSAGRRGSRRRANAPPLPSAPRADYEAACHPPIATSSISAASVAARWPRRSSGSTPPGPMRRRPRRGGSSTCSAGSRAARARPGPVTRTTRVWARPRLLIDCRR
jgi:hypothetical protein